MAALKLGSCLSAHAKTRIPLCVVKKCSSIIRRSSIVDNHDEIYQGMSVTGKPDTEEIFQVKFDKSASLTASHHLLLSSAKIEPRPAAPWIRLLHYL